MRRRTLALVAGLGLTGVGVLVLAGACVVQRAPDLWNAINGRYARSDILEIAGRHAPIRLRRTSHLLVPVRIDGHDAGLFVIDTGSPHNVIDLALVRKLALEPRLRPRPRVRGYGFAAKSGVVHVPSLDMGLARLGPHRAIVLDLSSLDLADGVRIAGIIGLDTLKQAPITLDLERNVLTFHSRRDFEPVGRREELLRTSWPGGSKWGVRGAWADGTPCALMLDTGAPHELMTPEDLQPAPDLTDACMQLTSGALGEPMAYGVGTLACVDIPRRTLRDVRVLVSSESGLFEGWHGALGLAALDGLVLTIDHARSRIWIREGRVASPQCHGQEAAGARGGRSSATGGIQADPAGPSPAPQGLRAVTR